MTHHPERHRCIVVDGVRVQTSKRLKPDVVEALRRLIRCALKGMK